MVALRFVTPHLAQDIGLRSTKIKTLDNQQLIIPNSDLCNTILTNQAAHAVMRKSGGRIINFGSAEAVVPAGGVDAEVLFTVGALVNRTGASVAQVKEVFPGYDGTTIGITSAT